MLFLAGAILFPAGPSDAATFTVNSLLDAEDVNPGNGICAAAGGVCTLRAAVQESNASGGPDIIVLPGGTVVLTHAGADEDQAATGDLDITDDVVIRGAGSQLTIIDGNGEDRVFDVHSGTVEVSGLTVRNGFAGTALQFLGGGIFNDVAASLALSDVLVAGNRANAGGGVFNMGAMTLARTTIRDNHVEVLGYTNANGGGLYNYSEHASLVFRDGTITGHDNGLYAVYNEDAGVMTLVNATVSGNSGALAAVRNQNATLTLVNVTIAANAGSGISVFVCDMCVGGVSVHNTVIAGNGGPGCSGTLPVTSLGFNMEDGDDCGFSAVGDAVGTDPLLGALQDNGGPTLTHSLQPGSPALDTADGGACPATDQRGFARPQGAGCDRGAYESTEHPVLTVALSQAVLDPGDGLVVVATLFPGRAPLLVDAYIVVRAPDGTYWSIQLDGSLLPGLVPIAAGFVAVPVSGVVFSLADAGVAPAGEYAVLAGVTEAGTGNLLHPVQERPLLIRQ